MKLRNTVFIFLFFVFFQNFLYAKDFKQLRFFLTEPLSSLNFGVDGRISLNELSVSLKSGSDSQAIGELMFNNSDVVLLNREFTKIELAPYIHQFAGDMMKTPFSVLVGYFDGEPVYLYANKRPDAPLPPNILSFIKYFTNDYATNRLINDKRFKNLTTLELGEQLKKIEFYIPRVDVDISTYGKKSHISGEISSVGSDGMKSLMDEWFKEFSTIYPGVKHGPLWEHLGTLNGFHALMVNQTDIAPMGRELWPEETVALLKNCKDCKILELRVAHGGFNTQQRTTVQSFFVNKNNPIKSLTLDQLRQIWGINPQIKTWGDLGLSGDWSNRRINLIAPPLSAPNARSIQFTVLGWGKWAEDIQTGSIPWVSQQVSSNEDALGFGGLEDMSAELKSLQISATKGSSEISISADTVKNRSYPLHRHMFIRTVVQKGKSLKPQVYEFLKFIVSKSAQSIVPYSGYFPLTQSESEQELSKLKKFK
jgi:ABC-type phosphate transport system substrate-binding protein